MTDTDTRQTEPTRIYESDKDRLYELKDRGESYADVVNRLLDEHDN